MCDRVVVEIGAGRLYTEPDEVCRQVIAEDFRTFEVVCPRKRPSAIATTRLNRASFLPLQAATKEKPDGSPEPLMMLFDRVILVEPAERKP